MLIVVDKATKEFMATAITVERVQHGLLVDKNNQDTKRFVVDPQERLEAIEVSLIPEGVVPHEYCYTKSEGFFRNPNYVPYYSSDQRIKMLEEQLRDTQMIINEVVFGL